MKLLEYWIPKIRDVAEFKQIANTEQPEINLINEAIEKFPKEIMVDTATDKGLSKYEKDLDLKPDKDIDIRRINILLALGNKAPFTIRWLINKLNNVIGEENYEILLNHNEYSLIIRPIEIDYRKTLAIFTDLRKQIPCNLLFTTIYQSNLESKLYSASAMSTYQQVLLNDKLERTLEYGLNQVKAYTAYEIEILNENIVEQVIGHARVFGAITEIEREVVK